MGWAEQGYVVHFFFFFSSRRRHTRSDRDWSSDVCSSDLGEINTNYHVARLEVDELVRAGADGLQIGRCVARLAADVVRVEVLRNDHAAYEIGRASCRERV